MAGIDPTAQSIARSRRVSLPNVGGQTVEEGACGLQQELPLASRSGAMYDNIAIGVVIGLVLGVALGSIERPKGERRNDEGT